MLPLRVLSTQNWVGSLGKLNPDIGNVEWKADHVRPGLTFSCCSADVSDGRGGAGPPVPGEVGPQPRLPLGPGRLL